jgi:tRNA(Leu) C34 or U34 (ribose-2'-O)-methylase TrmL
MAMGFLDAVKQAYNQFIQWIRSRLFLPPKPQPVGGKPDPIHRKVSVIVFNPTIPSQGGRSLRQVMNGNQPNELIKGYIADLMEVSQGYVTYDVVEQVEVDRFPVKEDGFTYTPQGYLACYQTSGGYHQPDAVDYDSILRDFDIVSKVNRGSIDEVWLFGCSYSGFYESRMVGPGSFFCNAPELFPSQPCSRRFVVMGFNWERGVGEMHESFCHRAESIMRQVFRRKSGDANLFQVFTRYDKTSPGQAQVGTVHYAPNSDKDYDWGNPRRVACRAYTWLDFPDLSGDPEMVDSSEWGRGDIRLHHRWWMEHLPHLTGSANGAVCNWWQYIVDPNTVN